MKTNSNKLPIPLLASIIILCHAFKESAAFAPIASSHMKANYNPIKRSIPKSITINTTTSLRATQDVDVDKLRAQAAKIKLEAEKLEAELNLRKINKLEAEIKASESLDDDAKASKRNDIRSRIEALASRVDPAALASLERSVGMTDDQEEQGQGVDLASAMQEAMKNDDSQLFLPKLICMLIGAASLLSQKRNSGLLFSIILLSPNP